MPVRDTTAWRHAIIQKKVINRDEGGWGTPTSSGTHYVMCAWSDCLYDGYEMFKIVERTNAPGYEQRLVNYVFCSERHKQLWIDELYRNR